MHGNRPTFAICIATYGDQFWNALAQERAVPSAQTQGADELLVRHDENGRRHDVRNTLAAQAKSDWLVFLDGDDHLERGFIDALRAAATFIPAGMKVLLNPAVGNPGKPHEYNLLPPKDLRYGNYLIIGTAVQRDLFYEVGGFHDWPPGFEDWELWIRCVKAGATVVQVPEAVYLIDSTDRSLTVSAAKTGRWFREVRRHHWPEEFGHTGKRRVIAR